MSAPTSSKQLPFPKTAPSTDWKLKRAIGNWNNLNMFLKTGVTTTQLQQMLNLEAEREGGPRLFMVERLFAKWVKMQRRRTYRLMGLITVDPLL
jgi:hypothetical protein